MYADIISKISDKYSFPHGTVYRVYYVSFCTYRTQLAALRDIRRNFKCSNTLRKQLRWRSNGTVCFFSQKMDWLGWAKRKVAISLQLILLIQRKLCKYMPTERYKMDNASLFITLIRTFGTRLHPQPRYFAFESYSVIFFGFLKFFIFPNIIIDWLSLFL